MIVHLTQMKATLHTGTNKSSQSWAYLGAW